MFTIYVKFVYIGYFWIFCYKIVFGLVHVNCDDFLRATAVPPGTAEACISYVDSVCLSVTNRCAHAGKMRTCGAADLTD